MKVSAWAAALGAVLKPLGLLGMFLIAAEDSAALPLPGGVESVLAFYVLAEPSRLLLFAAMAAVGSALGSMVIYAIGYKGGEVLLLKKIPQERFDRIRRQFDEHEFWTLALPAMLPPPFPFKVVALAAAVFEMKPLRFFLAIALGRLVRYGLVGFLVLRFGPDAMRLFGGFVATHLQWLKVGLEVVIPLAVLWWWLRWRRKKKAEPAVDAAE